MTASKGMMKRPTSPASAGQSSSGHAGDGTCTPSSSQVEGRNALDELLTVLLLLMLIK